MNSPLSSKGYQVVDHFIDHEECVRLLSAVRSYREHNQIVEIFRPSQGRDLRYFVIRGDEIKEKVPAIWQLYTGHVNAFVEDNLGQSLSPLANLHAGVNVNILPPGDYAYRWHYDRNFITAILYLNDIEGGETELYPNNRLYLNHRFLPLQHLLDRVLNSPPLLGLISKKVSVAPKAGRLVLMQGNRSYHSVSPVQGREDRINIIMAFDHPDTSFPMEDDLDVYLYTREQQASSDPNYR